MLMIRRMVVGFLARLGVRVDPKFGPLRVKRSAAVRLEGCALRSAML